MEALPLIILMDILSRFLNNGSNNKYKGYEVMSPIPGVKIYRSNKETLVLIRLSMNLSEDAEEEIQESLKQEINNLDLGVTPRIIVNNVDMVNTYITLGITNSFDLDTYSNNLKEELRMNNIVIMKDLRKIDNIINTAYGNNTEYDNNTVYENASNLEVPDDIPEDIPPELVPDDTAPEGESNITTIEVSEKEAKYSYIAKGDNELTIRQNEHLKVSGYEEEREGWAWVTNESDESGWVPTNILDEPLPSGWSRFQPEGYKNPRIAYTNGTSIQAERPEVNNSNGNLTGNLNGNSNGNLNGNSTESLNGNLNGNNSSGNANIPVAPPMPRTGNIPVAPPLPGTGNIPVAPPLPGTANMPRSNGRRGISSANLAKGMSGLRPTPKRRTQPKTRSNGRQAISLANISKGRSKLKHTETRRQTKPKSQGTMANAMASALNKRRGKMRINNNNNNNNDSEWQNGGSDMNNSTTPLYEGGWYFIKGGQPSESNDPETNDLETNDPENEGFVDNNGLNVVSETNRKIVIQTTLEGDVKTISKVIRKMAHPGVTSIKVNTETVLGWYQWPFSETGSEEELFVGFGVANSLLFKEDGSGEIDPESGKLKQFLDNSDYQDEVMAKVSRLRSKPAVANLFEESGIQPGFKNMQMTSDKALKSTVFRTRKTGDRWPTNDGWPSVGSYTEGSVGTTTEEKIYFGSELLNFTGQAEVSLDGSNVLSGGNPELNSNKELYLETISNVLLNGLRNPYKIGEVIDMKFSNFAPNRVIVRFSFVGNENQQSNNVLTQNAQSNGILIWNENDEESPSMVMANKILSATDQGMDIGLIITDISQKDDLKQQLINSLKSLDIDGFNIFAGRDKDNNRLMIDDSSIDQLFEEQRIDEDAEDMLMILRINLPKKLVPVFRDAINTINISNLTIDTVVDKGLLNGYLEIEKCENLEVKINNTLNSIESSYTKIGQILGSWFAKAWSLDEVKNVLQTIFRKPDFMPKMELRNADTVRYLMKELNNTTPISLYPGAPNNCKTTYYNRNLEKITDPGLSLEINSHIEDASVSDAITKYIYIGSILENNKSDQLRNKITTNFEKAVQGLDFSSNPSLQDSINKYLQSNQFAENSLCRKIVDGAEMEIVRKNMKINKLFVKEVNKITDLWDKLNSCLGEIDLNKVMGEDLENLSGAVKTYVKFRDHHTFHGTGQSNPNILEAIELTENSIPARCIRITTKLSEMCQNSDMPERACVTNTGSSIYGNVLDYVQDSNKRMPSADSSGGNIFYGPFSQVFNAESGNDDFTGFVKNRSNPEAGVYGDNLLNQLISKRSSSGKFKDPANLTFFGFGFSGSGKTYTLLEKDSSLLQQSLTGLISPTPEQRQYWGMDDATVPVKNITIKFYDLCPKFDRSDVYHYIFEGDKLQTSNPSGGFKT